MNSSFFSKYKVFIFGMAGAVAIALQQFVAQPVINWKAVAFACLMAVASYIGNEWRGQGTTILGFIGVTAATYYTINTTGDFTWGQFFIQVVIGYIALVAPPPKSLGYEKSQIIQTAKMEGEQIKQSGKSEPPGSLSIK